MSHGFGQHVLVLAYACEPGLGSEKGAGWHWIEQIAGVSREVTVMVRAAHRERIEPCGEGLPNVRFIYIDFGRRALAWKRLTGWDRSYYLLWQVKAGLMGRKMHRVEPFDCVHHLTWATLALFSGALLVPAPLVIGPVGGGVLSDWRQWGSYSLKGIWYEIVRRLNQWTCKINPITRYTVSRASVLLAQNIETTKFFGRGNWVVCSNAGIEDWELRRSAKNVWRPGEPIRATYVGRVVAWKGLPTALMAMATGGVGGVRLTVVGDGPDRERCEALAQELGLRHHVTFRGWLPRAEVLAELDDANILICPTEHDEGAPFVVVEAMARGVRPVALAVGGPRTSVDRGGLLVTPEPRESLPERLLAAMQEAASIPPGRALERAQSFVWGERKPMLEVVYASARGDR